MVPMKTAVAQVSLKGYQGGINTSFSSEAKTKNQDVESFETKV